MRRELLDLARSLAVRRRLMESMSDFGDNDSRLGMPESIDRDFDRRARLHEAVEQLPTDLREVFGRTLYHGWTQIEIAELLQISDRQVRRIWAQACRRLNSELNGDLPELKEVQA